MVQLSSACVEGLLVLPTMSRDGSVQVLVAICMMLIFDVVLYAGD